jgi:hypothetical protein
MLKISSRIKNAGRITKGLSCSDGITMSDLLKPNRKASGELQENDFSVRPTIQATALLD